MLSETQERYRNAYRDSDIGPYRSLLDTSGGGIPQRVKLFGTFHPQNTISNDEKFTQYRNATLIECEHLLDYLQMICGDVVASRENDAVVNAIVSLALEWKTESRQGFARYAPRYKRFVTAVENFARYEDGAYVYGMEFEGHTFAYCKCAFKLIKAVFAEARCIPDSPFQLTHHISVAFLEHLHQVHDGLANETFGPQDIAKLQAPMAIPFDLESQIGSYEHLRKTAVVKFITGQACAGKTTLLQRLSQAGNWEILSRGKIGGFSGKADNPVAVAALHASIEFTLRHSNVLGDRSSIDNPLWVGIMDLCDPKYTYSLVQELMRFLNANLNAAAIGYYINQRGVVFIDPYPSLCAQRMLKRNDGGDAFRARIGRYAITQAMAYYTIARLFGWKVYCVPYTEHRKFDPSAYTRIADELLTDQYFGIATKNNPIPSTSYGRPPNDRPVDHTYAKAVGIYK